MAKKKSLNMTARELLKAKRSEILKRTALHGARNVRVFGSATRGTDSEASDVDFLVDLEPGRSLLDQIALQQDLEKLLGRPVDVVVEGGISPYLERHIEQQATLL